MNILGIDGIDTFSSATKSNSKKSSPNNYNDSNSINATELPITANGLDKENYTLEGMVCIYQI
jgi:hypothetical protein